MTFQLEYNTNVYDHEKKSKINTLEKNPEKNGTIE